MMGKSLFWIVAIGVIVTVTLSMITTVLGIFHTKLPIDFYTSFLTLSFKSLFHSDYRSLWHQSFDAITDDLMRTLLFHGPFGVWAAYIGYRRVSKKTDQMSQTKFIKGTKLIPEKQRLDELKKKIENGEIKSRLFLGRIPVPHSSENKHTLIIAASGGGKGVLLTKIMMRISIMRTVKGLVHDNKPEWIIKCYRPDRGDLIFNPMDKRSIRWTIWNDIHDIVDIKNFASWIIPDLPGAKDPFWQNSARGILESILLYLWKENECTNAAIRRMVNLSGEELAEILQGFPGAEYASRKDSISTLRTQMAWVDFLPDGDFSIRDWVNDPEKRGLLFLSNTEKTQALFRPVLTLFVNAFSSHVLNLPDDTNRRIFMFLDEFTALFKLEKVIEMLKLGRSKGVSLWIAFQDFQQLEKIYSKEDMRTVINNCKNIAVGQIKEPDAAAYLSKRFGKQEFYEKAQTFSMGVANNRDGLSLNEQRKEDYVVKDNDLLNLPELQFYVMIDGLDGVTRTTADIMDVQKIAEGFIPVEMTKDEQIAMMFVKDKVEAVKSKREQEHSEEKDEEQTSDRSLIEDDDDGYYGLD
jgi:type IV secretory pathway TraG/TraD family ATPase VirD4